MNSYERAQVASQNMMQKFAGYFENLHGFKNEEELKEYMKTKNKRDKYKQKLYEDGPKKQVRQTVINKEKAQKARDLYHKGDDIEKASLGVGTASLITGGVLSAADKAPKTVALSGLGVLGSVGGMLYGKNVRDKANKIDVTETKKVDAPDMDKIREKVREKYPSGAGKDFGELSKYVTLGRQIEYKNKKGKYENPMGGPEYDRPYHTREELKKLKDKPYLKDNDRKKIDQALNSDYRIFTATDIS